MDIYEEYFNWLIYSLNLNPEYMNSHFALFKELHNIAYEYRNIMDENRYRDGIELRYHFGGETGLSYGDIEYELDICECTVLEMIVALILKLDNMITYEPKDPFKATLFYNMMRSLGLESQVNWSFDADYVRSTVESWMHGMYEYNGKGGLITLKYPKSDLRSVDYWTQVMWYITENEKLGGNIL